MGNKIRNLATNQFLGLVLVLVITSLACSNALTPTLASSNSSEPHLDVSSPTQKVADLPASASVQGWVTYTSKDNLYSLDIPKDWLTDHWSKEGVDFFVDNFQSPDQASYLEVFISDDGRPFPQVDEKYIYALSVLERIYDAKDIKVEKRTIKEDGAREILVWAFDDKRYLSVYEVTNQTSFVMLTMYYYYPETEASNQAKQLIENFKVEPGSASELSEKIEFTTVAEALAMLSKKKDVTINQPEGWTIITETRPSTIAMWSFAPKTHPAYPAVAKRVFYEEQKSWYVKMTILCEASKDVCNKFVQDFEDLNEEMRKYIQKDQLRKYLEKMQGG